MDKNRLAELDDTISIKQFPPDKYIQEPGEIRDRRLVWVREGISSRGTRQQLVNKIR